MRALVLTGKNEPLSLHEKPDLVPGEGEVIVRVHAAALNHRDVWIQKGQYAGLKYPVTPGSDGSGVVVNDPTGAFSDKEVIIDPAIHWGGSPTHQDPKDFRILGLPDDGTFAEYVKVPVQNIVERPAHLSFEEAAALPLAGVTAFRAISTRARLQSGEKVLITGIGGGVALFALQYAIAVGARVYVTSGSAEKIDKAIGLGALGGADYRTDNWGQSLQQQAGSFDVIIDGAGGDGMDELLNLATPGGRVVFYGATRGNPSTLTTRRIFWKQLNILGSTMGSPEDFRAMIEFVRQHGIRPIVDKIFPFAEGEAAMRHMDDAQQFGKIVISVR
jgi:NADPH:quinone reductase-like Zn-dependent oxidoreductase